MVRMPKVGLALAPSLTLKVVVNNADKVLMSPKLLKLVKSSLFSS